MTLAVGTRLGPYEVLAPLGAGGMGEVYRARDPRLGREVAIKVLPADLASDAGRLKRFEKEARRCESSSWRGRFPSNGSFTSPHRLPMVWRAPTRPESFTGT